MRDLPAFQKDRILFFFPYLKDCVSTNTCRAHRENSGLVKNITAYKPILLKVLRGVEVRTGGVLRGQGRG